ncbi:CLUMA_CG006186, isoform A [Clunio marinus]|uniref:CLUMA_CG006186, isoform A n=1 Tax=Clunio marinus TaxID=568069 RepID=A0A1J1HWY8_9DIPT|nr:CLUMA_CG006186, isoform A [Clunio marinus]
MDADNSPTSSWRGDSVIKPASFTFGVLHPYLCKIEFSFIKKLQITIEQSQKMIPHKHMIFITMLTRQVEDLN